MVPCSLPKPAGFCGLGVLSTAWSSSDRIQKGTVRPQTRTHVWYVLLPALNTHQESGSQFALMHTSLNPEKCSEDASQWPLSRVLESRAQSSAGSPRS